MRRSASVQVLAKPRKHFLPPVRRRIHLILWPVYREEGMAAVLAGVKFVGFAAAF